MALLDHFHEPLYPRRSWESFHARWAVAIGDWLHRVLPERYFAEIQVHLGNRVEADVAEFEGLAEGEDESGESGDGGGVAVQRYAAAGSHVHNAGRLS